MKQFNYKCVVNKNGTKMYYKRVNKKWQRISNKTGQKAEKGKKKYRVKKTNSDFIDNFIANFKKLNLPDKKIKKKTKKKIKKLKAGDKVEIIQKGYFKGAKGKIDNVINDEFVIVETENKGSITIRKKYIKKIF